jgi:tight adherence protein B
MEPNMILAIIGAIGIAIVGYLIIDSGGDSGKKRVENFSVTKSKAKKSTFSFLKVDDTSNRRKMIENSLADLEKNQKSKKKKSKSLKAKLIHANLKTDARVFSIISLVLGVIGAGVSMFLGLSPLISMGIGFILGFGFPRYILNFLITRRQKAFTANFSDAMDIIVRGVRTGLPLGDCLRMIAHEAPQPVGGEFKKLVEAESVGVPLETCIERMYERMPLSEVNFFGTVLSIQRSTGGNLGESLDNLSKVLRGRKLLREKIKALAAEAKVSAIIIGILPPGVMTMVSVVSPDYMHDLYFTKTGQTNLMISAGMMGFGIWVMRKMINFKF